MVNKTLASSVSSVPLLDLFRLHADLLTQINNAFHRIAEQGDFVLGKDVELFESEFAEYCGAGYAVGVNSGTDALFLALKAAGVNPGDEVITSPLTFVATVESIEMAGGIPVLADIKEEYLTLDPKDTESKITPRTKAIIPVHIYGHPADMPQFKDLGKKYNVRIIEDACQAHGAEVEQIKTGSLGDAGCFSFYPSKNLGGFGDGGIIVTNDSEFASTAKVLRNHGQAELGQKGYTHQRAGYCSRLDTLQAAVLRIKLKHLDRWNEERIKAAELYEEMLSGLPIALPRTKQGAKHVFYVYAIRSPKRDELRKILADHGIGSGVHYPKPIHLLPAMSHLGYKKGDFPISEKAADETLSLPLFPGIGEEEIIKVVESVKLSIREVF